MDWGTVLIAGVMAASNIGGFALLGKVYAGKVDKHDEEIPEILGTIKALNESAGSTSKCLDELYRSRNEHAESIVKLNERFRAQRELCDERNARFSATDHPRRRATDL